LRVLQTETKPREQSCHASRTGRARRDVAALIFLTLIVTYAYFWQARCWNSATRLMLAYAVGDRGTLSIDGLETQTRDRAFVGGRYFCDKPPGQSFLGIPFYLLAKSTGVSHAIDAPPMAYWWPDYLLTVATSGVLTAALGVLIYATALSLGCNQWPAVVVAMSYGLGTPAFTYATLFYGHQSAAFFAFAAFVIIHRSAAQGDWSASRMLAAGLLAGCAVIIEYALVFASLALLVYAAASSRRLTPTLAFCFGGAVCAAGLAAYHTAAFGGPLQLGYFHETEPVFQDIYSAEHPLGLAGLALPRLSTAWQILCSAHGLLLFAPITLAAIPGFAALVTRGRTDLALVCAAAFGSVFLINAGHPTWTGGFSTGPRYVLAGMPFLMIPVAAAIAGKRPWAARAVGVLGVAGFLVVAACTAYGGRLPDIGTPGGDNPLVESVLPAWRQGLFDRNLGKLLLAPWWWELPPHWKWLAFAPLVAVLAAATRLLAARCARANDRPRDSDD
jgi:hypothetical protein